MRVNREGEGLSSENSESAPRFPIVRKGLDQREVYPYIERIRLRVLDLERQNSLLVEEVADLRRQVENPTLDVDKVTELFGKQASEILRSAHDIASSVRKRAELNARDIISRAEREATDLELQASVSAEAQMTEASERAKEIIERAKSEAAEMIALAEQGAQSISERAKAEGRSLLHRARELRSKVFNEMQARIELLNGDIEELETSRTTLLQMLGAADTVLSEVRNDILNRDRKDIADNGSAPGLDDGHANANSVEEETQEHDSDVYQELKDGGDELAVETLPSVEQLSVVLDTSKEIASSTAAQDGEDYDERATVHPDDVGSGSQKSLDSSQSEPESATEPAFPFKGGSTSEFEGVISVWPLKAGGQARLREDDEARSDTQKSPVGNDDRNIDMEQTANVDDFNLPVVEPNDEVEAEDEKTTEFQVVFKAPDKTPETFDGGGTLGGEDFADPNEADVLPLEEDEQGGDVSEPDFAELDQLERLFERLKEGRDREAKAALEDISGEAPPVVKTDKKEVTSTEDDEPESPYQVMDDQPRADAVYEAPVDKGFIAKRDSSLADVTLQMSRRVKRILQDDQNDLLDVLRKGGVEELLKRVTELLGRFEQHSEALYPYLDQARTLGTQFIAGVGESSEDRNTELQRVVEELSSLISELSLKRISSIYASLESGESPGQVSLINSIYRDLRIQKVDEIVGDYVNAAFCIGVRETPGVLSFDWITFDLGGNCSDCDDNALANPNPKDEDFPTGHRIPPVHPGCRCMIVPTIA